MAPSTYKVKDFSPPESPEGGEVAISVVEDHGVPEQYRLEPPVPAPVWPGDGQLSELRQCNWKREWWQSQSADVMLEVRRLMLVNVWISCNYHDHHQQQHLQTFSHSPPPEKFWKCPDFTGCLKVSALVQRGLKHWMVLWAVFHPWNDIFGGKFEKKNFTLWPLMFFITVHSLILLSLELKKQIRVCSISLTTGPNRANVVMNMKEPQHCMSMFT